MDNFLVWVNRDVSKLEAFASICPVPADQCMVSAFIMNFPGDTPLDCKELDPLPRPPFWHGPGCVAPNGPFATCPAQSNYPESPGTCCHASAP